jgi:WXG100 family type VII secretion target
VNNKIQIRYEELEDIAHKVGKSADRVDDLITKARLCLSMLDDGAWIGRGSDKYRAEMEGRAVPALKKLLGVLLDLRYNMIRAGDRFRDAEETAARQIERFSGVELGGNGIGGNPNISIGGRGGAGGIGSGPSIDPSPRPGGIGGNPDFTFPRPERPIGSNPDFVAPKPDGIGGGPIPDTRPNTPIGSNPDLRIPDIFPVDGREIARPEWFTEYNEDIDGFSGAINGAVLLIDGSNSPRQHMGNIVGESVANGGVPVSGMNVPPDLTDSRQAERAASAVGGFLANNPNAQVKLSPGLQALINGVATDSLGRSLMDMPTQAQTDAMRQFIEILKTTAEAFGRVIPGL